MGMTIVKRVRNYAGFCKAIIFIIGVIFSYSFVEFAVLFDLISYLMDTWEITLPNAAAIVNFFDGLSPLMAFALTYIAEAYLGHFTVVLFSILAYFIGLSLLYILNLRDVLDYSLLYVGLFFIALGKASRDPLLRALVADQFNAKDTDESRVQTRKVEDTDESRVEISKAEDKDESRVQTRKADTDESRVEISKADTDESRVEISKAEDKDESRVKSCKAEDTNESRDAACKAEEKDESRVETRKAEDTDESRLVEARKAEDKDESRVQTRIKVWWNFASILGVIVPMLWLSRVSWESTFEYSAIVHGVAYVWFLCGIPSYSRIKPSGSPLTTVFRVFGAAKLKRHLDYRHARELYEKDDQENNGRLLLRHTSRLRWLDKAAIKEEHGKKWRLCTLTEVEETKLFLRMFPMWTSFLVYSLVESTGTTFFIDQGDNLKDFIGEKTKLPISFLYGIKSISRFAISHLYDQLLSKRLTESQRRFATKARIGVGMLSSLFCCCIAWLVESRRLNVVKNHGLEDSDDTIIPMSIFWLVPQFFLLGTMKGLAEDGLRDFFYDQVAESMWSYGPVLNDIVIGIGNLLSAFTVYLSGSWFADTLNNSRLDNYYQMLTVFSYINLGFYCYIASTFKYNEPAITEEGEKKYKPAEEEIDWKGFHETVKSDERAEEKGKE